MGLLVEMGWGGVVQMPDTITWTDITEYADVVQGVAVNRGASDERSDIQPGTATVRLDNADGRFTPGNSGSPYYPFVRRNAPIRVSVAVLPTRSGAGPWPLAQLADDFDDGVIDPVLWPSGPTYGGAAEVGGRARVPVTPGAYAAYGTARQWTLTGSQFSVKYAKAPAAGGSSSAEVAVMVNSTTAGTRVGFVHNPVAGTLRCVSEVGYSDGAAVSFTYSGVDFAWLRLRESGGTLRWETSQDGYAWTTRRTLATPAWVTSQTVAVEMYATRTGGTGDYAEFNLVGARVYPRFYGQVNEFPVSWEGLLSTVTVSATDLFKTLNRWPPMRSVLAEEILRQDAPGFFDQLSAYYPLTEPDGSTSAGEVSGRGCPSLALTQVGAGGTLEFGGEGLPGAGDSAVSFTPSTASAGKYLTGDLGPTFAEASVAYVPMLSFWIKTSQVNRAILGLLEPNLDHQVVIAVNGSGVLTLETTGMGGALTVATSTSGNICDDQWRHVYYDGSDKRLYVNGVSVSGVLTSADASGVRTLHVGGYRGGRLFSGQIAHLAISHATGPVGVTLAPHQYNAGTSAFSGETADARIERLALYGNLSAIEIVGITHDPVAGQGPGGVGLLARLQEIEQTESARLFAARDTFGLVYQSRDLRYNPDPLSEAFAVDYADLETGSVQLADDDQKLVNSVEATRPGGATQRVTAPSSITAFGAYEQQLNILKASDNSVLDAAYWLVSRYANPQPELREVAVEAYTMPDYEAILAADISSYFTVYGMPAQAPAAEARVTVEGYTETIRHNSHSIQFHTSASVTDSVWVLDDPVYSQLGTTTRLAY